MSKKLVTTNFIYRNCSMRWKTHFSGIPSRKNDKPMPPNHMKCKETIQVPVGLGKVWEPLEGLPFGHKLVMLMTPPRTDPALLQSCPNRLQTQHGEREDCALGLPHRNIRDLFPDREPPGCSRGNGEGSRAQPGGRRGLPSRTPSRVQPAGARAGLDHRMGRALS